MGAWVGRSDGLEDRSRPPAGGSEDRSQSSPIRSPLCLDRLVGRFVSPSIVALIPATEPRQTIETSGQRDSRLTTLEQPYVFFSSEADLTPALTASR